ncbi:MAG: hypothetical protein A2233_02660 [Candidatus Kerfeldbacteria bacterium RIFOXYA2_FULL_38_24]|uniref:Phosphatidic acid phosphatase type 2/haloperoxidase domain-containing protein n=1 Tax=Candidatus Kerfeldbacteria bacterium RIFOXYB2_FULL_38_14 TaxID=1798547 RepID=A0A1G2BGR1_9BACT|nr:MAG: hypothetical protein A2233_02660 [Candidatus Kerfeldbacteria bacterium RIFOXYA2_FULL_38_24]OGY88332.1 MAG: hypothetical protein A2319_03370 [Candidatus Kerfeldbacteria bacterium RIFOXYB2_FULL_38_14]
MFNHLMSWLLPSLQHFHMLGYWIALAVAIMETTLGVGLLVPGSTLILFLGVLSGQGYMDLGDLIWFAAVGAIIGDNINFYLGKKYGAQWTKNDTWLLKRKHFDKAKNFFNQHGAKSIFLGRFIPSIKELVPFIAGSVGMKRRKFIFWNILGSIGWSLEWILPGYIFTQSFTIAQTWLNRAEIFLAVLVGTFVILYLLKFLIIKKGKQFLVLLLAVFASFKKAILENKEVQKFIQKHNRLLPFIHQRLEKKKFTGLTLTVLVLVFLYFFFSLIGIVQILLTNNLIIETDLRIANLMLLFRDVALVKIFLWITVLGEWPLVLLFVAITAALLYLWKKRFLMIPLFVSVMGAEGCAYLGKEIFKRIRPDIGIYTESSFSFPSGHATITLAFYGYLLYLLLKSKYSWKRKINLFFFFLILIGLIGLSRLYLGVHYFTDVWAGYLIGICSVIVAIGISEWWFSKQKLLPTTTPNTNSPQIKKLAVIGALVLSGVCYVGFGIYFNKNLNLTTAVINNSTTTIATVEDIFSEENLKYTETPTGNTVEPVNFIIVANDDQKLIAAFTKAGWLLADSATFSSIAKWWQAAWWKKPYPTAPMTPAFWNSQINNFGFEQPTSTDTARQRHHARFWKTAFITNSGQNIYVGTASLDIGLKWGITHKINPDIDTEREYIFQTLKQSNTIQTDQKIQLVNPELGQNIFKDPFFTDGKAYIIQL